MLFFTVELILELLQIVEFRMRIRSGSCSCSSAMSSAARQWRRCSRRRLSGVGGRFKLLRQLLLMMMIVMVFSRKTTAGLLVLRLIAIHCRLLVQSESSLLAKERRTWSVFQSAAVCAMLRATELRDGTLCPMYGLVSVTGSTCVTM